VADRRDVLTKTVRIVVRGRVQGVGYRAWTERQARARGLVGSVRNRRDGSVEAVLSGLDEAVDGMLAAMQDGPPGALVSRTDVEPHPALGDAGFRVLPTI